MNWKRKVKPTFAHINTAKDIYVDNYLQTDIQRVLFPLTLLQYITFPKYLLRYNFITPNSYTTNVVRVFQSLIIFSLYFTFTFLPHIKVFFDPFRDNLYVISFPVVLLYGIEFIFNVTIALLQSDINVRLIINCQIIENCLKKVNNAYRSIIIVNWLYTIAIIVFFLTYSYIQADYVTVPYYIPLVVNILIVSPSDINVIYATRMIKLLRTQIASWISQLDHATSRSGDPNQNGEDVQKLTWRDLLKAYMTITDNYFICEKITEFPIILYVYTTFVHLLTNIQVMIILMDHWKILILSLMWTVKNSVLLTIISRECEGVYTSLRNARIACMLKLDADRCSDMETSVYKELHRVVRQECRPYSAKGLYTVNAALPLQMLSVVATYTIVILQFNFL